MELYSPMGNYFYIKKTAKGDVRLHELPYDNPQYVAQAILPSLNIFKKMGSLATFLEGGFLKRAEKMVHIGDGEHSVVKEIRDDHWIDNYAEKIGLLDGKGSTNKKKTSPGVEVCTKFLSICFNFTLP